MPSCAAQTLGKVDDYRKACAGEAADPDDELAEVAAEELETALAEPEGAASSYYFVRARRSGPRSDLYAAARVGDLERARCVPLAVNSKRAASGGSVFVEQAGWCALATTGGTARRLQALDCSVSCATAPSVVDCMCAR